MAVGLMLLLYFIISPTHGGLRQWASHGVKSNETMVGIALKYDLTVEDIRRCNNLWTNDALWTGQVGRSFNIQVLSYHI